jgi:hypothetical protein
MQIYISLSKRQAATLTKENCRQNANNATADMGNESSKISLRRRYVYPRHERRAFAGFAPAF